MSGPIGHTFMYNIILTFIFIVFAFLIGTLTYYKGFKVNNRIVGSIEKYEGYNELALEEIKRTLSNFGYFSGYGDCEQEYKGMYLIEVGDEEHNYCIYASYNPDEPRTYPKSGSYYQYGVLTYMRIDVPLADKIRIPIFTRTNRIYKFSD